MNVTLDIYRCCCAEARTHINTNDACTCAYMHTHTSLHTHTHTGKLVALDLSEGAYTRSVKGVQSPGDLEIALQLLHLLFTTE